MVLISEGIKVLRSEATMVLINFLKIVQIKKARAVSRAQRIIILKTSNINIPRSEVYLNQQTT